MSKLIDKILSDDSILIPHTCWSLENDRSYFDYCWDTISHEYHHRIPFKFTRDEYPKDDKPLLEYVKWSRKFLQSKDCEHLCDSDKNYLRGIVLCDVVNKQWGNPDRGAINKYCWQEDTEDQEKRMERWQHTIIEELSQPYVGEEMNHLFKNDK